MGTHQTRHTMSAEGEDGSLNEYLYKVLVVGDIGTGKTSIIKRYVHNIFSMHYKSTIGVDFALKVINWDENSVVRLQLWDIAGQERFGNMTRVYYKEAVGAFVVFDVTRVSTFEAVQKWKSDIDAKVFLSDNRPIPVVLFVKIEDKWINFVKTMDLLDGLKHLQRVHKELKKLLNVLLVKSWNNLLLLQNKKKQQTKLFLTKNHNLNKNKRIHVVKKPTINTTNLTFKL